MAELCGQINRFIAKREQFKNTDLEVVSVQWLVGWSSQGIVGRAVFAGTGDTTFDVAVKVSYSYLDWDILLESRILRALSQISWCPNFSLGYGEISTLIDPENTNLKKYKGKDINIFSRQTGLLTDVNLTQFIPGKTMDDMLKKTVPIDLLHSLVAQLMGGLAVAGELQGFTHNDLHPGNIIVTPMRTEQIVLYKIFDGSRYEYLGTRNYKLLPVVIDFGTSYCAESDGKPWLGMPGKPNSVKMANYPIGYNPINDIGKFMHFLKKPLSSLQTSAENRKFLRLSEVYEGTKDIMDNNSWPSGLPEDIRLDIITIFGDIEAEHGINPRLSKKYRKFLPLLATLINFPPRSRQENLTESTLLEFRDNLIQIVTEYGRFSDYVLRKIFEAFTQENPVEYFSIILETWWDDSISPDLAVEMLTKTEWVNAVISVARAIENRAVSPFERLRQWYAAKTESVNLDFRTPLSILRYLSQAATFPGGRSVEVVVIDTERQGTYKFTHRNRRIPPGIRGCAMLGEEYETRQDSGGITNCSTLA